MSESTVTPELAAAKARLELAIEELKAAGDAYVEAGGDVADVARAMMASVQPQ